MVPFCAVTTVVIVLLPPSKGRLADAVPEVTAVPLTVTVAVGSVVVGVIVTEVTELPKGSVYEVVPAANAGDRVPLLMVKFARVAIDD